MQEPSPAAKPTFRQHLLSVAILLGLSTAMFANVLFSGTRILSHNRTDLILEFLGWQKFGFGELHEGRLALWNPHLFSGAPFFGGFQPALLYPPNWLHLLLPLATAINVLIALHIFLSGLWMYCWAARRGLRPVAGVVSAALLMFSGAQFLHVYAGHTPHLATMSWTPLLLLAIDEIFQTRGWGWVLVGILAATMQVLAGQPQYVYYCAITAAVYVGLQLHGAERRLVVLGELVAVGVGAAALSAVQLFTGVAASGEMVRCHGTSYDFATMYAFPPENLLTLLTPGILGDMVNFPYWGRWRLWEMSLFVGVAGLLLAVYGAYRGNRTKRLHLLAMIVILAILGLGHHTPLFAVLFRGLPCFNQFRGTCKFMFFASIFLAMLAGVGMDTLLQRPRDGGKLAIAAAAGAASLSAVAIVLWTAAGQDGPALWWRKIVLSVWHNGECYMAPNLYTDDAFLGQAARFAATSLGVAAGTMVLIAALLLAMRRFPRLALVVAALAIVEVFVFARISCDSTDLAAVKSSAVEDCLRSHPGDYRILNCRSPNEAMLLGASDIWGYDPGVPLRYAELIAYTQGEKPNSASLYVTWKQYNRIFQMLRLRFAFVSENGRPGVAEFGDWLPQLQFVRDYRVIPERDRIFAALSQPDFNFRRTVILECPPEIKPATSNSPSSARLVDWSTDHMTIEAKLDASAILLVTDGWSRDWKASPMPGSAQQHYAVMPANYVLRAIPMKAGTHRLRLEYLPTAFVVGKWVSIVALAGYLVSIGWFFRQRLSQKSPLSLCEIDSG